MKALCHLFISWQMSVLQLEATERWLPLNGSLTVTFCIPMRLLKHTRISVSSTLLHTIQSSSLGVNWHMLSHWWEKSFLCPSLTSPHVHGALGRLGASDDAISVVTDPCHHGNQRSDRARYWTVWTGEQLSVQVHPHAASRTRDDESYPIQACRLCAPSLNCLFPWNENPSHSFL